MSNVDWSGFDRINSEISSAEKMLSQEFESRKHDPAETAEQRIVSSPEHGAAQWLSDWSAEKQEFLRERGLDGGQYLRENFKPTDRIAVVLMKGDHVIQRIDSVSEFARDKYQAWLRDFNAKGYGVYHSMNTIKPYHYTRREADIAAVRHVWLDMDKGGRPAVDKLLSHADIPAPHYVLSTSPDRHQLIWRAGKFSRAELAPLLKSLAKETGADPAATAPATWIMRMPGFRNQKYPELDHYVTVERIGTPDREKVTPRSFPERLYVERKRERVQEPPRERSREERVGDALLLAQGLEHYRSANSRNSGGFHLAQQLRDNGYSEREAAGVMRQYRSLVPGVDASGRQEPYTEREMMASLRSAYSQPAREPWALREQARSHGEERPRA